MRSSERNAHMMFITREIDRIIINELVWRARWHSN